MTIKTEKTMLTVQVIIHAPLNKVWELWTNPIHTIHWNYASPDWHSPRAKNDLRVGGRFLSRMEARDGSMGFDFEGEYIQIEHHKKIAYTLDDSRNVEVNFSTEEGITKVIEMFEAEQENTLELQQAGWQAILNNFKKYVEDSGKFETLHFEIAIGAKVKDVFRFMLEDTTYREWTAAFSPTSYFKGSWEKGSKIMFLGTDSDGKVGGMVSRIIENIPNKFVSIEHLGLVKDDLEITTGPEVESWAGAMENYTFAEKNGKTLLSVDLDANQEFKAYFSETWPKALDMLKKICER